MNINIQFIQMTSEAHSQELSYQGMLDYYDNSIRLFTPSDNYQVILCNEDITSTVINESRGHGNSLFNPRAKAFGMERYFTRRPRDPLVIPS